MGYDLIVGLIHVGN